MSLCINFTRLYPVTLLRVLVMLARETSDMIYLVLQLQIFVSNPIAAHLVRPDCLQVSFTFISIFTSPGSDRSRHWWPYKIAQVCRHRPSVVTLSAYFGHNSYELGWWLDIGYVVVMVVMAITPTMCVMTVRPMLQSWLPSFNNGLPTITSQGDYTSFLVQNKNLTQQHHTSLSCVEAKKS